MDKIILSGMWFLAHHGVTEEERRDAQPFEIDAEILTDIKAAAENDDISLTVDYDLVYKQIREVVVENSFALIETLAEAVAAQVLSNQLVEKVIIRVRKVEPPIAGRISGTAVEINRGR